MTSSFTDTNGRLLISMMLIYDVEAFELASFTNRDSSLASYPIKSFKLQTNLYTNLDRIESNK